MYKKNETLASTDLEHSVDEYYDDVINDKPGPGMVEIEITTSEIENLKHDISAFELAVAELTARCKHYEKALSRYASGLCRGSEHAKAALEVQ